MSVPKSRRGESPAEYIDLARKIYVFTYDRDKQNRKELFERAQGYYNSITDFSNRRRGYAILHFPPFQVKGH